MQILKFADLVEVPWKNGGGITRNIARGTIGDQVAWTISRADVVRDGAFSDFTGMMRVLTVVSGGPMVLESERGSLQAERGAPVCFDGGLRIHARLLDGPLSDLNLMFDPVRCHGEVAARHGPAEHICTRPARGLLAFHVLSGAPVVNDMCLTLGDTVFCDAFDATVTLAASDAVLQIRLDYPDQSAAIRLCIAAR